MGGGVSKGGVKTERLDEIRSRLYTQGFATIQALASSVGVSLATIRRDLQTLEAEGAIDRVHGGARIADGSAVEVAFQERAKQNLVAKRTIAASAYGLLRPRATVFLDAGTTVLQLARLIRINPMPLRIFTNGLAVAQELLDVAGIEVALLGGQLRSGNASLVGPLAEEMLQSLWLDQLFLGASAISTDGHIFSIDSGEASLNRRMLSRSSQSFVLADSSKFGATATYRVASLAKARIVTDCNLSSQWRAQLADMAVDVTIAEGDPLP